MAKKSDDQEIINLRNLSDSRIWDLRTARWKARTDLGFLCRNILGFEHVTDESSAPCPLEDGPDFPIHQPILDILQKFPNPTQEQFYKNDLVINGKWQYSPILPLTKLQGHRRVLILDPRGFLKTTINMVAHSIQWIINYPDIAIMIVQSNGQKANDFLDKIKKQFQGNPKFRRLFPEHCPTRNVMDWGRQDRFNTEARSVTNMRSEPTVMATSIDRGAAGYHVDVIKFSDIVDPVNITGNGIQMVKDSFYMMHNLLVGPKYWIDVEGTRYAFADLYGKIIEDEMKLPIEKRQYKIHVRPVFKQKMPPEETPRYTPDQLDYDFELNEKGRRIPLWPRRFALEELEYSEQRDPFTFATQQLNNPAAAGGTSVPFPTKDFDRHIISRNNFQQNVRIAYKEISIDCAYTQNNRSDYTAIVVGTFDHYNRCYIEEIEYGRWLPDEIIKRLIACIIRHYNHLRCLKIEDVAYTQGMLPGLRRILDTRNLHVTINTIKRDNQERKVDRILKTLQPAYKSSDLRFLEDIEKDAKTHLLKEMKEFPSGTHEDMLDAMADLFQDKEWFGREVPHFASEEEKRHFFSQKTKEVMQRAYDQMVGGTGNYDPLMEPINTINDYNGWDGAL